jgi:manganese/iron transport system permease protein/iron/zinc/copper transport system permease protein
VAVAVFVALGYKRLLFMTFDPEVAPIFGIRSGWMDALFALALAATIVASINVVGVTLIAATLIIPATTARLLTDSFARMMWLSAALGALSGAVGMYASYWLDISSGATIVLLEAGLFCVAFTWHLLLGHRSAWADTPVVTYHGRPQVMDDL